MISSFRVFLLVLVSTLVARAAEPTPARPNVLFIMADDLNHWVGYLGRNKQTKTPNIDRLAASGMSFTRSYCAAPVCNPSRAALFSGRRPGATGVYGNAQDWRTVVPKEETLITTLRRGGYEMLAPGKSITAPSIAATNTMTTTRCRRSARRAIRPRSRRTISTR